ncbi:MAG: efflux RND transporter periplasmic adaptor subunit [Deltaproteobacteria bacterium]|jgi:membrane fusion protein (multidrug efflux system)|nr:efflux RND transporter periplasmic adaptor subunit [Deltaproteobacteria bacterium]
METNKGPKPGDFKGDDLKAAPAGAKGGGGQAIGRAISVFLILGLAWLAYWFVFLRPYVTTDDAYVVGNQIRLSPSTAGRVSEILFDNTQKVEAGQVLVKLSTTDAELAFKKAQEELAQAVRQLSSQKRELERLEVLIKARQSDLALVENEYDRRKNLKTGSSVTAEEVERYRQQTVAAQANLEAARHEFAAKELLVGRFGVKDHPQVKLAVHKLREAWLSLRRCEIKSPASGRVARRTVQVGAYVTQATNLMAIVPLDEVWVEANFKESQLGRIRPGHEVIVSADMYGGSATYRGRVLGLSAGTGSVFSLLPAENATGNWIKVVQRVPVKILLDKQDLDKNPLLLGLSLKVRVKINDSPGPAPTEPSLSSMKSFETDDDLKGLESLIEAIMTENLSPGPPETAGVKEKAPDLAPRT